MLRLTRREIDLIVCLKHQISEEIAYGLMMSDVT